VAERTVLLVKSRARVSLGQAEAGLLEADDTIQAQASVVRIIKLLMPQSLVFIAVAYLIDDLFQS
jgi:hypothetical protein